VTPTAPHATSADTGATDTETLQRTRDELVLVLDLLRRLVGDHAPAQLPAQTQQHGADPYPTIVANLKSALASLRHDA
jgi:hypothetical protein